MTSILITGGGGDWAKSFGAKYGQDFNIVMPNRNELDVTNDESVVEFFKDKKFDVVINNAGSIHPERILDSNSKLWINDIHVNLVGTYLVAKNALKQNKDTVVINISSTAGFNAYPDWSSYCSSKAGVITLTKCLSNDGFNVYCLCPGGIDTKFRDKFDLPNNNLMSCDELSEYVIDILNNKYYSGDVLFVRKGEFVLNP